MPRFHQASEVVSLNDELLDASDHFLDLNSGHNFPFDFSLDFEKLKKIYGHASKHSECIVSALDLGDMPNLEHGPREA